MTLLSTFEIFANLLSRVTDGSTQPTAHDALEGLNGCRAADYALHFCSKQDVSAKVNLIVTAEIGMS